MQETVRYGVGFDTTQPLLKDTVFIKLSRNCLLGREAQYVHARMHVKCSVKRCGGREEGRKGDRGKGGTASQNSAK